MAIEVDPGLGDVICTALEKIHGVSLDIVLIVMAELGAGKQKIEPSFVTSLHPDIMEAVVIQLAEQMADSKGGRRIITGKVEK